MKCDVSKSTNCNYRPLLAAAKNDHVSALFILLPRLPATFEAVIGQVDKSKDMNDLTG